MADSPPRADSPDSNPAPEKHRPTAVLVLAALQGLALLGLHYAVDRAVWPATTPAVLIPLYLNAALLPLTAQLLVRFIRRRRLQWSLAGMAAALAVFGWHHAAFVAPGLDSRALDYAVANVLPLAVLWLIVISFLRAQLETDRSAPEYRALFAAAWRNQLVLLEASLFVGVFWMLLGLCATLFNTLDIGFFWRLFSRPAFVYPATAVAIGMALHLIGSVDRIVDVVLAQVLSLFKWLAPIAGLIVILFAVALLPEVPRLFAADERPLNSLWLLWLVAVTVLLLNAAYQDGTAERPYGAALSTAMRFVPPLLTLIALTAAYALYVRVDAYGITVGRFWGLVTACVGLAHAASAAVAAARSGPWLGYTSKTNPVLAAGLALVLILALTPVLSPYRLSAASQQRIALETNSTERLGGALTYLRFSAGGYGSDALQELAALTGSNPELAASAEHTLQSRGGSARAPRAPRDFDTWRRELRVYPEGRQVPAALEQALRDAPRRLLPASESSFALWIDTIGGPELEFFVSLGGADYELYAGEVGGPWRLVSQGFMRVSGPWGANARDIALARGDFAPVPAELPDLRIGERTVTLMPLPDPAR